MRLKEKAIVGTVGHRTEFQFQTGAIKSYRRCPGRFRANVFQFQTGAIKSHSRQSRRARLCEFQFQTGAIKSEDDTDEQAGNASFNSKLVRLKVQ